MKFRFFILLATVLQLSFARNRDPGIQRLNVAVPSNPLAGQRFYMNPTFQQDIQTSVSTAEKGVERNNLAFMRDVPTAFWLDKKSRVGAGIDSTPETVEGVLKNAGQQQPPPLVTLVVYNLPNRDCGAKASNGEICCAAQKNANGTCNYLDHSDECVHGLRDYKRSYIDEIAKSIRKYCEIVPMALVIEPDSLPNLITNLDNPRCGGRATQASYKVGVPYAVKTLSKACPTATMYVDAAHGAWLGWQANQDKFATLIKSLNITQHIRGFSLNVANYNLLGKRCSSVGFCLHEGNRTHSCCKDPCNLTSASNPSHSELNYAMALHGTMTRMIPDFNPHMVIDTSRNAVAPRKACSSWCNARGAGSGALPTVNTDYPEVVDAYMWVKIPGESDGCTELLPNNGGKCLRFDEACASNDSIGSKPGEPRCPEAGEWFDYQVKMLARNAGFD